jgi:hypothetical protein
MPDHDRSTLVENLRVLRVRLGDAADRCALVGASCASLFPPGRVPIRETADIDLIVRASGYAEWQAELGAFRAAGFLEDPASPVMCRLVGHGLIVDVMPVPWDELGTNLWYVDAWNARVRDSNTGLFRITPLYFLATKLEAFKGRGRADPAMSDDLADIVIFLRNQTISWVEIEGGTDTVHRYIRDALRAIAALEERSYAVSGSFEGTAAGQAEATALLARLRGLPP